MGGRQQLWLGGQPPRRMAAPMRSCWQPSTHGLGNCLGKGPPGHPLSWPFGGAACELRAGCLLSVPWPSEFSIFDCLPTLIRQFLLCPALPSPALSR